MVKLITHSSPHQSFVWCYFQSRTWCQKIPCQYFLDPYFATCVSTLKVSNVFCLVPSVELNGGHLSLLLPWSMGSKHELEFFFPWVGFDDVYQIVMAVRDKVLQNLCMTSCSIFGLSVTLMGTCVCVVLWSLDIQNNMSSDLIYHAVFGGKPVVLLLHHQITLKIDFCWGCQNVTHQKQIFRMTLTWMISLYKLVICLGSTHLLWLVECLPLVIPRWLIASSEDWLSIPQYLGQPNPTLQWLKCSLTHSPFLCNYAFLIIIF